MHSGGTVFHVADHDVDAHVELASDDVVHDVDGACRCHS